MQLRQNKYDKWPVWCLYFYACMNFDRKLFEARLYGCMLFLSLTHTCSSSKVYNINIIIIITTTILHQLFHTVLLILRYCIRHFPKALCNGIKSGTMLSQYELLSYIDISERMFSSKSIFNQSNRRIIYPSYINLCISILWW